MALFAKSLDTARADLAKAEAAVTEWEGKETATRAEVERLNAAAGDMILNDASTADTVGQQIQTLERKVNAEGLALAGARAKLLDAHRSLLEAEAAHEDKSAAAAGKEAAKHEAKVKTMLDALQELNGVEYRVQTRKDEHGVYKPEYGLQVTNSLALRIVADGHTYCAAVIREYLETGEIHNNHYGMGDLPGLCRFDPSRHVPASVRAAKAAGLQPVGA